jgi:hypothetical protein
MNVRLPKIIGKDGASSNGWLRSDAVKLILTASAMAIALAITVFRLLEVGRVSRDPGWDDLAYLLNASDRLDLLRSEGAVQSALSFFTDAPHSFYSELLAFSALGFSDGELVWVYVLNAAVIVILVFFIFRLPELGVSLPTTLALQFLFVLGPVGFFLIDEFRPDPIYFLTIWVILSLRFRALNGGSKNLLPASYLLLGLLWFIKPSFLLVSLGLFVVAATLDLIRYRNEIRARVFPGIVGWLLLTGLAALTVLPNAVRYVIQNTVGENEEIWVDAGMNPLMVFASNVGQSLLYVLHPLEWLVVLFCAAIFFSVWQLRTMQGSWVKDILVFYTVIVVGMVGIRSHSVFFGMHVVFGVYLFALVQLALLQARRLRDPTIRLIRLRSRPQKLAASMSVVLLTIGAALTPNSFFTASQDKEERFVNKAVTSVILSHCSRQITCREALEKGRGAEVFVGTISAIDAGVINWYFWNQGLTKTAEGVSFFPRENILMERAALDSDYIVLLGEDNLYRGNPAFKATQMQEQWRLELDQSSSWKLISSSSLYAVYAR